MRPAGEPPRGLIPPDDDYDCSNYYELDGTKLERVIFGPKPDYYRSYEPTNFGNFNHSVKGHQWHVPKAALIEQLRNEPFDTRIPKQSGFTYVSKKFSGYYEASSISLNNLFFSMFNR